MKSANRITALVAGHRLDRLSDGQATFWQDALEAVLASIRNAVQRHSAELHVLTGVEEGTDQCAAKLAMGLGLPLELLAPGAPQVLDDAQQDATKIVWLGATKPEAHGSEAVAIRDDIALGLADLLVVVWDGDAPHGLGGGTVRLALKAARREVIHTNRSSSGR